MVVPPPIAEPWTAATSGLSKLTNAIIKRAWDVSPDPGGLFRKSSTSLPAQNESPAPCQSTTRICSSFAAALRSSARVTYMFDVIAFFFSGRFNWIRKMLPERSVRMSLIVHLPWLLFWMLDARNGTARAEALNFGGTEPELFENLFVVFADFRGALGRHFRDAVHLNRAADRELQLPARSFERNDD